MGKKIFAFLVPSFGWCHEDAVSLFKAISHLNGESQNGNRFFKSFLRVTLLATLAPPSIYRVSLLDKLKLKMYKLIYLNLRSFLCSRDVLA